MKTLLSAFAAVSLLTAPIASAAPADEANVTYAAPNKTAQSKNWKVGDRVPGTYVGVRRYLADVEALKLPKPPRDLDRWIHVGDNAYLVDGQTDRVLKVVGVPAKS